MVVDESLFGRKTKTKGRGGALLARAAVISAAELRRIQGSTRIITAAEIQKVTGCVWGGPESKVQE